MIPILDAIQRQLEYSVLDINPSSGSAASSSTDPLIGVAGLNSTYQYPLSPEERDAHVSRVVGAGKVNSSKKKKLE